MSRALTRYEERHIVFDGEKAKPWTSASGARGPRKTVLQKYAGTAQARMRLAAGRIVYTRDQHVGRVYVGTICPICGRLWYTPDAIRRVTGVAARRVCPKLEYA
jgi:hypothetical protein